ncbi:MAG: aminopeptidase P family protein [Halioglobus sp.]|nr:aminopeptidase P family protein [Halioglobus sp.]
MSIADHLADVRRQMASEGIDALLVPRADEYLGEYLPDYNERLRWLTGFTGSAGLLVLLPERAAIFVDGRYSVQVRRELHADLFEYLHLHDDPAAQWLAEQLDSGAKVGCDTRMHSLSWFEATAGTLQRAGIELVATADNLVDRCWTGRPRRPAAGAMLLPRAKTGEASADKRARIARALRDKSADAALIFAPDSISWLLNIRGGVMPQLPVVLGMGLLHADGEFTLFTEPDDLPGAFASHVGEGVSVLPENAAPDAFAELAGKSVLADPATANAWSQLALRDAGVVLIAGDDPVLVPKACKNAVELDGSRAAHLRDAVAEVRFLAWLDREVAAGRLHDEGVLAEQLLGLRCAGDDYHALSFDTISAAGANAALCHYNHLNAGAAPLTMDSVYLVDSGAQYLDGTTDITRTVAIGEPGDEVRRLFTLVLKGHIALARARFPAGTTGTQLDALARQFLWREGFDFDHGTGHGVGVFLSVHEGPQRISKAPSSVALRPGMIVSNEPGYYRDGAFGMRCENLQVVRECAESVETPMLEFETLSLAPFDRRLLAPALLDANELQWLNDYHARVNAELAPLLDDADREWLLAATAVVCH